MNCEGCEKSVGDLKSLRTHRKSCVAYKTWNTRFGGIPNEPAAQHVYEGRIIPTMFA